MCRVSMGIANRSAYLEIENNNETLLLPPKFCLIECHNLQDNELVINF